MTAPAIVAELVERFDAHRATYESGQYHEAQLRQEAMRTLLGCMYELRGFIRENRRDLSRSIAQPGRRGAMRSR